jgi:hypothetical protein
MGSNRKIYLIQKPGVLQGKFISHAKVYRRLVLMYTTNFLDRTALAQARLGSLEKDLQLTGVQFNTITSVLFIVSDPNILK